jgi:ribonuclease M5
MKMVGNYSESNENNTKKPIIVVEGKTDVDKVSKLVDAYFIITNGSEVSRETISYLQTLARSRKIIVLTDPDYPGLRIRNIISNEVPGVYHAYVDRSKSSNGKKLGVAECDENEIKRALSNLVQYKYDEKNEIISPFNLYALGLTGRPNSRYLRNEVYKHFELGYGNAKTLAKHLSLAGISQEELIKFLKEIEDDSSK